MIDIYDGKIFHDGEAIAYVLPGKRQFYMNRLRDALDQLNADAEKPEPDAETITRSTVSDTCAHVKTKLEQETLGIIDAELIQDITGLTDINTRETDICKQVIDDVIKAFINDTLVFITSEDLTE